MIGIRNKIIAVFSLIGSVLILGTVVHHVQFYNYKPSPLLYNLRLSLSTTERAYVELELNESAPNDSTLLIPCPRRKPGVGAADDVGGNSSWGKFLKSLEDYAHFHKQQVAGIKNGNSKIRTLSYVCDYYKECGGIGDHFYRIQQALLLAMVTDRVLILNWDETSRKTFQHLLPNRVEWNLTLDRQTVRNSPKIHLQSGFNSFLNKIQGKDNTHIKISTALPVPFLRGMKQVLKADEAKLFSRVSLYEVDQWNIGGEMLRYLFTFSSEVFQKVEEAQKRLGIFNKPYVATHIRTGFLGTEYEEVGNWPKENPKIFRSKNAWLDTVNCSLRLSRTNGEMPLYLATDSYAVKELAIREFGDRVKSLNMTLQHAAIKARDKTEDKAAAARRLSVDGYVAIWVDYLLLARADILVRPPMSGFSTTAGQFCAVQSEFYLPSCSKASLAAQLTYYKNK